MSGRFTFGLAGLAVLLVGLAPVVRAHDGKARLILEPDRVSPGGVVVVRGEDVSPDDEMHIVLIDAAGRTELATALSDGQGHFSVTAPIPPGMPVRQYVIEATGTSGVTLAATLLVEGLPVTDEDPGAPPGQDEGLPAIPPSGEGRPAPDPDVTSSPNGAPAGDGRSGVDPVPLLALVLSIGTLGLLWWRTRSRPAPQAGPPDLP